MLKQIMIISSLFLIGCGSGDFSSGFPTQSKNTTTTTPIVENSTDNIKENNTTNISQDSNSTVIYEPPTENIPATPQDNNTGEYIPTNDNETNTTIPSVENNNTSSDTDSSETNTTQTDDTQNESETNTTISNEEDNSTTSNTDSNETNTTQTEDNIIDNNETNVVEDNTTQEEILIVENNDTRANIILVHGLNNGSSVWSTIAPRISNYMQMENNSTVDVGIDTVINSDAKCFDGAVEGEILCSDISNIDIQRQYRSIANDKVFGLKKGDFSVVEVEYKINGDIPIQAILQQQKVFAINFSSANELSFDAQGYELKKIIDDISMHTGIDNFVLIGHSMGGLAIRAYIQNEEIKTVEKVITLNTPHLGGNGGTYNETTRNAGVNFANDSKSYQILNSNIANKYDNIKLYYLGYSGDVSGSDDELYFSLGDDVVDIGSQMGIDILDSYRIIFSPNPQTMNTFQYISSTATKEWTNESIEIDAFNTLPHNAILQDEDYIYVILDIIKK